MFPIKDNIPLSRVPLVTIALVAIIVVAYLLAIFHGGGFIDGPSKGTALHYGAIPYELAHPGDRCSFGVVKSASVIACQAGTRIFVGAPEPQPATWTTIFTSMFLHGSFLALFFNLLFLVLFGPSVENAVGRGRFLCLYLAGGLVALALLVAVGPSSFQPALGASGAIAAVLGAYLLLHPRARVITLVLVPLFATIVEIPALILLALWLPLQLWLDLSGLANPVGGSEWAVFATQLVGVPLGLAAVWAIGRRRDTGPPSARPLSALAA
ncbi:MAG TPA: rhomboid family intramembrane serine protease [Solirubrobacteraceae bacterium]|jgi:membrane associated rhomboid family serine protease|nr:rhomboid family intramembrane serine protease [Solirubrobacteraceae bacterium]